MINPPIRGTPLEWICRFEVLPRHPSFLEIGIAIRNKSTVERKDIKNGDRNLSMAKPLFQIIF